MLDTTDNDIADLAHDLKQEKLFIDSEKQQLRDLHTEIVKAAEEVFQTCWVRGEQRRNYHDLLRPNSSPAICFHRANVLHTLSFVPSHKALDRLDPYYGSLLWGLRQSPELVAKVLAIGDQHQQSLVRPLVHTLFSSLYASCILTQDHTYVLTLLRELLQQQVCSSPDPRRLLRHGSCAFSQLFRTYVEALPQAKVFLTAALHQPLLELLAEDDLFLDTDPSKAPMRFPPQVRARKFGTVGTPEYEAALNKYRNFVILRLANLTNRFLSQLSSSMQCFPPTLLWLVRNLYHLLLRSHCSKQMGSTSSHNDVLVPTAAGEFNSASAGGGTGLCNGDVGGRVMSTTMQAMGPVNGIRSAGAGDGGGGPTTAEARQPNGVTTGAASSRVLSPAEGGGSISSSDNPFFASPAACGTEEVTACCIDLVFVQFFCPALVEPEPLGICDAPVSPVARFNLMQVGQIIQSLAMSRCESSVDPRLASLNQHLHSTEMGLIVSSILEGPYSELPPVLGVSGRGMAAGEREGPIAGMVRDVCLIPLPHLQQLLAFLHSVVPHMAADDPHRQQLESLVSRLKPPPPPPSAATPPHPSPDAAPASSLAVAQPTTKKGLMNRVKTSSTKSRSSKISSEGSFDNTSSEPQMSLCVPSCNGPVSPGPTSPVSPDGAAAPGASDASLSSSSSAANLILSAIAGNGSASGNSSSAGAGGRLSPVPPTDGNAPQQQHLGYDCVLVVTMNNESHSVMPGLMSEEKLLASIKCSSSSNSSESGVRLGDGADLVGGAGGGESSTGGGSGSSRGTQGAEIIVEKRTRFSLSHDEGSIGNTSDNLEAVSEAASNHSVASSLDDVEQEDQPDNLSDMMSANVSGRGTPNVSGRDTPSSQVTEGEEGGQLRGAEAGAEQRPAAQNNAVAPPKPAREDIEEKFGKFEIKPLVGGDETFSLVSDTWSTDVLASDSETIEAADRELREERQDFHDQLLNRHLQELDRMQGAGRYRAADTAAETFETTSEAWSTDVLTSDSERLQEFDTDDSQSVARSDDAGRSEVDAEVEGAIGLDRELMLPPDLLQRSNTPDNITPRAHQSRSPVDVVLAAAHHNNAVQSKIVTIVDSDVYSSAAIMKPTPVLPESLSLDSASSQRSVGPLKLKPTPVMHINNGGEDPVVPLSAPPTIGFRPISSASSSGTVDLLSSTIDSDASVSSLTSKQPDASAPLPNGSACHLSTTNSSDLTVLSQNLQVLTLHSGNTGSNFKKHYSNDRENSLSSQKSSKLVSGGSAEDNSLHLSTTSLASSTSSSCELNGRLQFQSSDATGCLPDLLSGAAADDSSVRVPQHRLLEAADEAAAMEESTTEERNLACTGAIPKSISFDKTAEHGGDRDLVDGADAKNKKSFFKSLKKQSFQVFKGRRKGAPGASGGRSLDDQSYSSRSSSGGGGGGSGGGGSSVRRGLTDDVARPATIKETSDDILAKYRSKKEEGSGPAPVEEQPPAPHKNVCEEDERLMIDPNDVEGSYAFADAKRKLRLVLSVADLPGASSAALTLLCQYSTHGQAAPCGSSGSAGAGGVLSWWLVCQIAEARTLQDRELLAQLTEAHRCLQLFDIQVEDRLVVGLREDYRRRAPYIAYLVRARQGLLTSLHHLNRMLLRVRSSTGVITRAMVSKCVALFLERRDVQLREFTRAFTTLIAPDEKVLHVSNFLDHLSHQMKADDTWRNISEEHLASAEAALEQAVMSHIYDYALYPNGDVDINRDQVLYDHIHKLSEIISPNHKDLCIPKLYQYECPWPSAQMELSLLAAYRTAGDKLSCVVRSADTVMNLLSLAHTSTVPAADDAMPVLIYVIIKANPRHLLSTIQYVNVYFEHRMAGKQQYYWTQFCSAVEFIKTMDYVD